MATSAGSPCRWEQPSQARLREEVRRLLGEASMTANPRRRWLLNRRAFEMAQSLAMLDEQAKPAPPLPVVG
jgi:hypothetical protein